MQTNNATVGTFQAKTKFSELLSRVEETGAEFEITKHDRPVARGTPTMKPPSREEAAKVVAG